MSHGHSHNHGHPRGPSSHNKAFAIATALNVLFVGVESLFGVLANSTALLADAAHNLTDVLGLTLAWGASTLATRSATSQRTYGLKKTTIFAALANALLLLVAVGGVVHESLTRFSSGSAIEGVTVVVVAACGVVINGFSAALFISGAKHDANLRGAYLHLLMDAAISLGVVAVGLVLVWQPGWLWLDASVSLVISAVVLLSTWSLLKDTLHLSLDGVPPGIELERVRELLEQLPEVSGVHDLHIWALSTSETALTAHLLVTASARPQLAAEAGTALAEKFGIAHSTIQLDPPGAADGCRAC